MQTYVTAMPDLPNTFFNSYYSTSGHATVTLIRIKVFVLVFTNFSSAKCSYMRINSDYTNDKYEWQAKEGKTNELVLSNWLSCLTFLASQPRGIDAASH